MADRHASRRGHVEPAGVIEPLRAEAAGLAPGLAPPLVVRFAAFGDVVLLTPLLEILHRRFGRRVELLGAGDWTPELLAQDPHVGEVRLVRSRRAAYALCPSQWQAVRWLRTRPPGPIYLCEPDDKAQWLLDRAGIDRRRVLRAFDFQAQRQIAFSEWWTSIAQLTPEAWRHAPLAQPLPDGDPVPRLHLHPVEVLECAAWLRDWLK